MGTYGFADYLAYSYKSERSERSECERMERYLKGYEDTVQSLGAHLSRVFKFFLLSFFVFLLSYLSGNDHFISLCVSSCLVCFIAYTILLIETRSQVSLKRQTASNLLIERLKA